METIEEMEARFQRILQERNEKGKRFWSNTKVVKLLKMGYPKYFISTLQDWYTDITNVPFETLLSDVQNLKDNYVNDEYNQPERNTMQSVIRGNFINQSYDRQ